MEKKRTMLAVVCLVAACGMSGCLGDDNGESAAATLSMGEFMDDYSRETDNESMTYSILLGSFEQGDKVIISDTIHNVTHRETQNTSWTALSFSSYAEQAIPIEGDITGDFERGDAVELHVHIINATFSYQGWTIEYETFEEGWDRHNDTQALIPQRYLQHAAV
ncbi:MAG: hypothetical protein PHZ19_05145 [Candidatus Thermoplasmatota archaeon]|nr:hypothetical protein [Candidatus Thermoplasmatota archaeon]